MDWIGLNGPKWLNWTKFDWSGMKLTEWTKVNPNELRWTQMDWYILVLFFNVSSLDWYILVLLLLFFYFPITSPLSPSYSFGLIFLWVNHLLVRKWKLILYQNKIYMAMYLNVPINCNYVISFDYHVNLLKRMRNLKLRNFNYTKRN